MSAAQKPELPPGWRPEWRAPKEKTEPRSRARARLQPGGLPQPQEIYERAMRSALDIAEDVNENSSARVGAVRVLLEAVTRGKVGETADVEKLTDAELARRRRAALEELAKAAPEAANDDDGKRKEPEDGEQR